MRPRRRRRRRGTDRDAEGAARRRARWLLGPGGCGRPPSGESCHPRGSALPPGAARNGSGLRADDPGSPMAARAARWGSARRSRRRSSMRRRPRSGGAEGGRWMGPGGAGRPAPLREGMRGARPRSAGASRREAASRPRPAISASASGGRTAAPRCPRGRRGPGGRCRSARGGHRPSAARARRDGPQAPIRASDGRTRSSSDRPCRTSRAARGEPHRAPPREPIDGAGVGGLRVPLCSMDAGKRATARFRVSTRRRRPRRRGA